MDERARRVGRNEALFRSVNDEVEGLNRGLARVSDATFHIVCECGDLTCSRQIVVPLDDYERIRADSALFFVLPGHEQIEVEDVVEDADAYGVVRKHPGEPQRIAEETDRRAV
jgi:hypothetical protein